MDTSILDQLDGGNNPSMPVTRPDCQEQMITLQSEIRAIRDQIAAADLNRQASGGQIDAAWFHRARTALRHKQERLARIKEHIKQLPGGKQARKQRLKDAIIEIVRSDYEDSQWRKVLDEAHCIADREVV
ncbi:hypothetical protein [Magnetococcus sp. PR-3]|uniref:hypothetical protein n=1 Tax=Magnetococcus sp. PR-3 TaxID=3120355 RepID=UPI002FCE2233